MSLVPVPDVDEDPENFPPEHANLRPIQFVNCTGVTEDGLLSYNYAKKAKYALKLPERNEEILLPNAEAVGAVLLESGRQKITKWTVYDYFNTRRRYGQRLLNKLEGAILRKL